MSKIEKGVDGKEVAVIGAGLVGCLAAIALHKKGYQVTMFEMRQDPRKSSTTDKNLRSINLAISDRGFRALKYVDQELLDKIMDKLIPMYGRMIHDIEGKEMSQLYGLYGESINSIDRGYLNEVLLNEIDLINSQSDKKITVLFGKKLTNIQLDNNPIVEVIDQKDSQPSSHEFAFIIGSDGAFSATRYHVQKKIRMNYTQEFIDTCYIELYIPLGPNNSFLLDPNHLHIWPRDKFMLIALPNQDGSFTSTFFGPWEVLESLDTREKITTFFEKYFSDVISLIGIDSLVNAFLNNPKGSLLQVHCNPYNFKGKAVLIGDAAHAMVPFYGQGMNCGFESLRILMETLEKNNFDSEQAFDEYSKVRHDDLELILKLALDNYKEMSHKVTNNLYLMRKKMDGFLSKILKDKWLPLYTMVSFRGDIPYSKLIRTELRQQKMIKKIQNALFIVGLIGVFKVTKFLATHFRKRM